MLYKFQLVKRKMTESIDLFTREISASSYYALNNESPEKAFGLSETSFRQEDATNQWTTAWPSYVDGAFSGNYICCHTIVDGKDVAGEWLQVQSRNTRIISGLSIQANCLNPARAPTEFVLAGSNDGSEWTMLHSETGIGEWTPKQERVFRVDQSRPLRYFRLIVLRNAGDGWVTIDKLRFLSEQHYKQEE